MSVFESSYGWGNLTTPPRMNRSDSKYKHVWSPWILNPLLYVWVVCYDRNKRHTLSDDKLSNNNDTYRVTV